MIPQVEPIYGENEIRAICSYLKSGGWITEGSQTAVFEEKLSSFLRVPHCSLVSNGTMGLILALKALGIGKGDRVAVPALTMIATANAVKFVGATPKYIDVDPQGCMDADKIRGVDAVVYVSLNGRATTIDDVSDYCNRHEIPLIEDACQAFGSCHGNKRIGTIGDIGVFSFSPHKIITTGQGGLIVTKDSGLYSEVEKLKDFGRSVPGSDDYGDGINAKFTDLQAVFGIEQLKDVSSRIARKRMIYLQYRELLEGFMLPIPSSPWFMDIYVDNPDRLKDTLKDYGIGTRMMYAPLADLPQANILSKRGLFLPSSLNLTNEKIKEISEIILRSIYG